MHHMTSSFEYFFIVEQNSPKIDAFVVESVSHQESLMSRHAV